MTTFCSHFQCTMKSHSVLGGGKEKGRRWQRKRERGERGKRREVERKEVEGGREEGHVSNAQWLLNSLYRFAQELHFYSAIHFFSKVQCTYLETKNISTVGLGPRRDKGTQCQWTLKQKLITNQQTGSQYHF